MKNFLVTCLFLSLSFGIQGQPLNNDTVVCIVDTTKTYVQYWYNPIQKSNYQRPEHWQVEIEGSYYDGKPYEEAAVVVFRAGLWSGVDVECHFPQKRILKKDIESRFKLVDDKWIHEEKQFYKVLRKKIGFAPFDKYNFIIFSQDYYDSESDSVTMHRVEILYGEVWD